MILKRAFIVSAACIALATSVGAQPYGGMGLGMMGGYGMGPGMMGGYGMGPGMMGGYNRLDLSAEQRKQIKQIQDETAKAQWQLMGTMHQKGLHMDDVFGWGEFDEKEARNAYQAMANAHKAMFDLSLEARKRINSILTKEQREKLRQQ